MAKKEEELRQSILSLELYKAQLENLNRQIEILNLSLQEYLRARETAKRCEESSEGDEILIPIGADSYLYGRIMNCKKALVGVGCNVCIENSTEATIKIFDKRIEEIEDASKKLAGRAHQIEQKIRKLSAKIQRDFGDLQRKKDTI